MIFEIGQKDEKPRLYMQIGGEFHANIPDANKVVYQDGDQLKLYWRKGGQTLEKNVSVVQVIDGGKAVIIMAEFTEAETDTPGRYPFYVRNETKKLRFPSTNERYIIKVNRSFHVE